MKAASLAKGMHGCVELQVAMHNSTKKLEQVKINNIGLTS
jgi:hypothetical protein